MLILGLSFGYHDAGAALINEAGIIAAAHEERFSRNKNDASFPINAIKFCLQKAGINVSALDYIVYYEDALAKFDRIAATGLANDEKGQAMLIETVEDWFREGKFYPQKLISQRLGISPDKIICLSHHLSHAASTFLASPFNEAAILTLDGVGEKETLTLSKGKDKEITKLAKVEFPDSLGLFYSAFTAFLGFEVNEGEYKVMGMAGFGKPRFYKQIMDMIEFNGNCSFKLKPEFFNFTSISDLPYTQKLIDYFGEPRKPEAPFSQDGLKPIDEQAQLCADIAASVQLCTEEAILHLAQEALTITQSNNLCLAGGVALNSAANGRIRREINCNLFIQPAAGDAGAALGAALYQMAQCKIRLPALQSPYLGQDVNINEITSAIEEAGIENYKFFETKEELLTATCALLQNGKVVGWMQGRTEWGPRALGNRSILAHPGLKDMKNIVNEKIKFREPFRPFAPSVLIEKAEEFFELPLNYLSLYAPENFMLAVCPVKESAKPKIPAITHVDGSARVHLVRKETNYLYYSLIKKFSENTNIPLLLNTSFNLRGEAIVNQPKDAIKTFLWSGMDALVIDQYIIMKDYL